MRKLIIFVTLASVMTAPLQAADWRSQGGDMRAGAFVGARIQLPLGGKSAARPRAALALAPTMNRMSGAGTVRTTIGEGLALNFTRRSRPTLTLAGVRADTVLALRREGEADGARKLGLSKGGTIAIVVGVALVVGAAAFYAAATHCADHEDECG